MAREAMSSRTAAGTVRAALAEVAKAFGHEHRIELIEQLAQGPSERRGTRRAGWPERSEHLTTLAAIAPRRSCHHTARRQARVLSFG